MDMNGSVSPSTPAARRGRPARPPEAAEAWQRLIRAGLVHLTEKGYSATGLDEVLRAADVPKGSFYHYFDGKTGFGLALVEAYRADLAARLDRWFGAADLSVPDRLRGFTTEATDWMARHEWRRGCLVGNLGQEMGALPEPFRARLVEALEDWQDRTAHLLSEGQTRGEIASRRDPARLAALFWIGWEGAVLRAKLERGRAPLDEFTEGFFALLDTRKEPPCSTPS